jgi:hypothetical protein
MRQAQRRFLSSCRTDRAVVLPLGGGGHAGSLPQATLLATAVLPMPDMVRSISTSRGVVAAAAHEQKLELAERLL